MANYSLVVNSKFNPFSFERYIQPYQIYGQNYKELENQYAELATKANVWEKLANDARDKDSQAYQTYKSFSNDLENLANTLAKEGLNPSSRRNALKMLSRYKSDITPIEEAYKRRQELTNSQLELLAKDNTLMFNKDASLLKLDDLIRNPNLTYQSYSGATLAKQVGTAAAALAKEMRNNPRKWNSILQGQYFETMMKKGYTPEEIILASSNDSNAPKELRDIVEDAIGSSNIASWGDQAVLNRAYDYARQGLWNAVGETQYQVQSNKAYDYEMQLRLANAKKKQETDSARLPYTSVPRTKVGEASTTKMKEDIEFINKIKSNPELLNEKKGASYVHNPWKGGGTVYNSTPNLDRWNKLTKQYGTKDPDKIVELINKDIEGSAVRDFTYAFNFTDNKLVNKVISERVIMQAKNSKLPLYELDEDNNIKGKQLSDSDYKDITFDNGVLSYDPYIGPVYTYSNKDGEIKKLVLDTEVLDNKSRKLYNYQAEIDKAIKNKDYTALNGLIYLYMNELDGKFNTLAKIQSNTDNDLTIE